MFNEHPRSLAVGIAQVGLDDQPQRVHVPLPGVAEGAPAGPDTPRPPVLTGPMQKSQRYLPDPSLGWMFAVCHDKK